MYEGIGEVVIGEGPIDNTAKEKKRERVDALRRDDKEDEDSVVKLAYAEGRFREIINSVKREDVSPDKINEIADLISDEPLGRLEAEQEKWIDNLTGLRNRNAYLHEASQFISMEKRRKNECVFLMVDFDHFKDINDSYGHVAGDQALQQMARVLSSAVRASDIVYRYGGEEFLILLPDTTAVGASQLAERVRAAVENATIDVTDKVGQVVQLHKTVSIGCVGTDQLEEWGQFHESDADAFLERIVRSADAAVYASKAGGRNKVTLFHDGLQKPKQGAEE